MAKQNDSVNTQVARTPRASWTPPAMEDFHNPEMLTYMAWWLDVDRAAGKPYYNRHRRAVEALAKRFGCSEITARQASRALRQYRTAMLASELPDQAAHLVADLRRVAEAAERDRDYAAATKAYTEIAKITGCYAPIKVDVEHHQAPPVRDQLRQMIGVLSPEAQAGLALALEEFERARVAGLLPPAATEDAGAPPAPEPAVIIDVADDDDAVAEDYPVTRRRRR